MDNVELSEDTAPVLGQSGINTVFSLVSTFQHCSIVTHNSRKKPDNQLLILLNTSLKLLDRNFKQGLVMTNYQ